MCLHPVLGPETADTFVALQVLDAPPAAASEIAGESLPEFTLGKRSGVDSLKRRFEPLTELHPSGDTRLMQCACHHGSVHLIEEGRLEGVKRDRGDRDVPGRRGNRLHHALLGFDRGRGKQVLAGRATSRSQYRTKPPMHHRDPVGIILGIKGTDGVQRECRPR
jgi:hypothetical protein